MLNEIVTKITNKNNEEILIRYPMQSDLKEMHRYINEISSEDTFINIAEEISLEEEKEFLENLIVSINSNENVTLIALDSSNKMVGISGIGINKSNRSRSRHIGILGVSIAKDQRGTGIGEALMRNAINESIKKIHNLRSIVLYYYSDNEVARKLYEKIGFVEVGRIKDGIFRREKFVDEVIMQKEIK